MLLLIFLYKIFKNFVSKRLNLSFKNHKNLCILPENVINTLNKQMVCYYLPWRERGFESVWRVKVFRWKWIHFNAPFTILSVPALRLSGEMRCWSCNPHHLICGHLAIGIIHVWTPAPSGVITRWITNSRRWFAWLEYDGMRLSADEPRFAHFAW